MAVQFWIAVGKTCTRKLRGKDLELSGKDRNDFSPIKRVPEQAMHQNQCRAASGVGEANVEAIDENLLWVGFAW